MLHLDLFSGIGGFALAARWCGFTTIGFSEIDEYCCKILKRHWPDVPNYGDIRTMRGIPCDLITGGFPCQPFSLAGKRRGASDDRAIWPEMLRVIGESEPRWVLAENVPGIIGMELDRVLSDLENLGYSAWPVVIPACAVDAKHRRNRVWIVAHANGNRRTTGAFIKGEQSPIRDIAEGSSEALEHTEGRRREGEPRKASWRERFEKGQTEDGSEQSSQALADTYQKGERRLSSRAEEAHTSLSISGESVDRETILGSGWLPEPQLGRVAHGIPNRIHRLRGLGNAIVPQVAYQIMRHMK